MHWKNAAGTHASKGEHYNLPSGVFSRQFHVYSIVWAQDIIKWYVDDQPGLTVTLADAGAANYPFNADYFFCLMLQLEETGPDYRMPILHFHKECLWIM